MKHLFELAEEGYVLILYLNGSYYCEITSWGVAHIEKRKIRTLKGEVSTHNLGISREEIIFEG
jgi:hypothetical protein